MADLIRYDLLAQDALRGVVRKVLSDAAKNGLPGDHHFFIEFNFDAPGVKISERLRQSQLRKSPDSHFMTIVLQHQFWDLVVTDKQFEIGLSFGGVPEKLVVPFDAIKGFYDPSVQFGLQFEIATDAQAMTGSAANEADGEVPAIERRPSPRGAASEPEEMPKASARTKKKDADSPAKKSGRDGVKDGTKEEADAQPSAQVVSLDKFRKK
ncbi:MAG TPA: ClpXP protease specificity-enhancing factor SspB [Xanthobacteraceae bacterium]|jgi:hypothetical protein|nr:ClpXP protease specificity-enhancing factor SspB [Xanthobacteraceae bacterium]